jgi:hypothetical protein
LPGPSFEGHVQWRDCSGWPTGAIPARVHRGSKTPTRPATGRRCSRAFSPAACASAASANDYFHEHDSRPLEHPEPPNPWLGRLPRWGVASPSRRPPEVRRARGRDKPISTLSTVIAHGGDFAPTPIAPGTSCREAPLFALSGETWGKERVRRRHACLHRSRDERVVRRPTSAKKPDVHQPEGPSIEGPPVRAVHCHLLGRSRLDGVVGAFFTAWNPFEGRSLGPGQLGCRQASR